MLHLILNKKNLRIDQRVLLQRDQRPPRKREETLMMRTQWKTRRKRRKLPKMTTM